MKHLRYCATGLVAALSVLGQAPPSFTISAFAGNGTSGFSGDSGAATSAQLNLPFSVWVAGTSVYIADQANHRIRMVSSSGTISTIAGNGTAGSSGDGAAPLKANIADPAGVTVDSTGNVYLSDTASGEVRKISGGNINQYAGAAATNGFSGDAGLATSATLSRPTALMLDSAGNLLILDTGNDRVRKVTISDGFIHTIAGDGNIGFSGDGAAATAAAFNNPEGMTMDAAGNIYIADSMNNRIRKVGTDGNISTVAGSGFAGYSGDGGAATAARLNHPRGIAVDSAGNLYIADSFNSAIRMVTGGNMYTIAGTGTAGFTGDGGPAGAAQLNFPTGVAIFGSNILVTDSVNHEIRLLTPNSSAPSILGNGVATAGAFGGAKTIAPGSWIEIFGSGLSSTTRGWATSDFVGTTAPTSLDGVTVNIGGQLAFVGYVSPHQVNAQVPSTVGAGPQQVVVAGPSGDTAPFSITVNTTQPGLLAPPSFNVGGKQYAVAQLTDSSYVAPPGSIAGVTTRQAKPGETIVLYGVGFGPVAPASKAGQITQLLNGLQIPVQFSIGQTPAKLTYGGLLPGQVGLYQFNMVVPAIANNDLAPLTFTQLGAAGTQTLFIAVKN